MKKLLALVLAAVLVVALLAACTKEEDAPVVQPPAPVDNTDNTSGDATDSTDPPELETTGGSDAVTATFDFADIGVAEGDGGTIVMHAFTVELPEMADAFTQHFPDFNYDFNPQVTGTDGGGYQTALDTALAAGGSTAPDMYAAEMAFVLKYTQGDQSQHALPFADLGIVDAEEKVKAADIAKYAYDLGKRGNDLVALPFQATGSAFIYRRSIATEVFGADDSATVKAAIGGGSGNWDKFYEAADQLVAAGYKIVSGIEDVWKPVENSSNSAWIVNDKLVIDPKREAFLDIAKTLKDNRYTNEFGGWSEDWTGDMAGKGNTPAFGFLGPAWLINYVMAGNSGGNPPEGTYGDWNLCESPVGFGWGGTWIMANKSLNATVKPGVRQFIEWVTLDTTDKGLQSRWANGTTFLGTTLEKDDNGNVRNTKDTVASNVVMKSANGNIDFLGGANMFDVFVPANNFARGDNKSQYDEDINTMWIDQVNQYIEGNKDRDAAIADFKSSVSNAFGLDVD